MKERLRRLFMGIDCVRGILNQGRSQRGARGRAPQSSIEWIFKEKTGLVGT